MQVLNLIFNDILKIDPNLFEMIAETMKIKEETEKISRHKTSKEEGVCEECGEFDSLYNDAGVLVCASCYDKK